MSRPLTKGEMIVLERDKGTLGSKGASEIRDLRKALESIREQTKCRSVKGGAEPIPAFCGCWFADYGRHAPDCNWEISKEADDALKEADK